MFNETIVSEVSEACTKCFETLILESEANIMKEQERQIQLFGKRFSLEQEILFREANLVTARYFINEASFKEVKEAIKKYYSYIFSNNLFTKELAMKDILELHDTIQTIPFADVKRKMQDIESIYYVDIVELH